MCVSAKACVSPRFIYETEHFNGVAELLEILGRSVHVRNVSINKNPLC